MVQAILGLTAPPGRPTPPTRSRSRSATRSRRRCSRRSDDRAAARQAGRAAPGAGSCSTSTASATSSPRRRARCAAPRAPTRSRSRRTCTCARTRSSSTASPSAAERELFEHLLSVTGVGPKVALAIVSGSSPDELRRAIVLEDTARFEAIPGIGKKTAQRVVLELKEKLASAADAPEARRGVRRRTSSPARRSSSSASPSLEAEQALAGIDPDLPPEEQGPARAEEGGMSETQFLAPRPLRRGRGRARALAAAAPARTSSSGRSG